ncbi:biofilm development regulator YmgB/AriR family protein [Pantoea sp. SJZ147]|uniref:biofilm development regulator YmgB/AriR family protein n=1 Tax=Pantoea sp. SJZ147 TaxID=2572896 RepID=UPI00119DB8C1|nr:biofilm development regulator YmgB/AriR family protein [Pantoea sp. SJZ147]TWD43881.1 biofilm development protein YmgB/AriR [Pantoea sp. SJZ147]
MRGHLSKRDPLSSIAHLLDAEVDPSYQRVLGQIVSEILRSGNKINKTTICIKIVQKSELAADDDDEKQQCYREILKLLFIPAKSDQDG